MSDETETYMAITANRLRDGIIVYFREKDGATVWTTALADATAYAAGEDMEAALGRAKEFIKSGLVISVYAVEITGNNMPLSAREAIRAHGPSIKYGADAQMPDFSI
jgi:hypothetical protein